MLAELVDRLVGLGERRGQPHLLTTEKDPRRLWLTAPGGTMEEIEVPAPRRNHNVHSLADAIDVAKTPAIAPAPEIYVDSSALLIVLNRDERDQFVQFKFVASSRWDTLCTLATGRSFNVAGIRRLLRFELHSEQSSALLGKLSALEFVRHGVGVQSAKHGEDTLGQDVKAAVNRAEEVPETFTVNIPVYSNLGIQHMAHPVIVGIHLDTEGQAIVLQPLADELENARRNVVAQIVAEVRKDVGDVKVYNGTF